MNNITIELCAEDRARIDNLTAALEKLHDASISNLTPDRAATLAALAGQISEPQPAAEPVPAGYAIPQVKQEAPKAEEPKPEPAPAPTPTAEPAKEVTVDELRAKVMQLINAGKKDATRTLITSYAPNVTEIPADKRAEVLEKLNELEG